MSHRFRQVIGTALTVAIVAAWFVLLRPVPLGGSTTWVVIRGDSMEPVYQTGDLVILTSATDYQIGDIAAYRVPAGDIGEGQVVIHRIIDGNQAAGFVLQGDNNEWMDPWLPTQSDMVGRAWVRIPGLGRVFAFLHDPIVLAGLVASLVVGWIIARPSRPGSVSPTPGPSSPERRVRPQPDGMRNLRPRSGVA